LDFVNLKFIAKYGEVISVILFVI